MIKSEAPILASLHDCISGSDLIGSVNTNLGDSLRKLPFLLRGHTGYIEPWVEYHEDALVIPHISTQHLGLGQNKMENIAFSAKTGAPISIANHVKTLYNEYTNPTLNQFYGYLSNCTTIPHGIYAGTCNLHWGHFALETLPRLALLSAHLKRHDQAPIYFNAWKTKDSASLPQRLSKAPYVDYLTSLEIDPNRIRLINRPILIKHMLVSSSASVLSGQVNYFSLDSIQRVRHLSQLMSDQLARQNFNTDTYSRIYLSRKSLANPVQGRRLINEKEIEDILSSMGFHIVDPSLLTSELSKQAILSKANVIAGCAGSGLLNSVFASKANHTITLTSPKSIEINPATHQQIQLDRACGVKSHLFVGDQLDPQDDSKDTWTIKVSQFRTFLEDALS
jgi:hypothetical protein